MTVPNPAGRLDRWAAMMPEDRISADGLDPEELSGCGLRPVGAGHAARRPSWLLPARHPAFDAPATRPATRPPRVVRLWRQGSWQGGEFDRIIAATAGRNWWFRGGSAPPGLVDRVRATGWLPRLCDEFVTRRLPGAHVVATYLIGSYLWADRPSSRVDAVAVCSSPDDAPVMRHETNVKLPRSLRFSVDGAVIDGVDLLVVSRSALREPERLTGQVGDWRLPDGRPYPCDIRRQTVARAVMRTLRSGLLVDGVDVVGDEPDDFGLLAHAYYFVQEASVLLGWRDSVAKAANRLLEASLVLDHLTGAGQPSGDHELRRLCTAIRSAPHDPELLRRLQGWHGETAPAALPVLVERLVRARQQLLAPFPTPDLGEVLRRADQEAWPTWHQARHELEHWLVPAFPAAEALLAWSDPGLPSTVRSHLAALGVTDPRSWLGEPLAP